VVAVVIAATAGTAGLNLHLRPPFLYNNIYFIQNHYKA
jgi:hypothetical protein